MLFMRSDGGLTPMQHFSGARAILSGPAGGVVGYAVTTPRAHGQPVIGFDMGGEQGWGGHGEGHGGQRCQQGSAAPSAGTSTDVSRFAGAYEHVFEATTAGISIQAPQLDINTVAAGGGSRLFFRWVGGTWHPWVSQKGMVGLGRAYGWVEHHGWLGRVKTLLLLLASSLQLQALHGGWAVPSAHGCASRAWWGLAQPGLGSAVVGV